MEMLVVVSLLFSVLYGYKVLGSAFRWGGLDDIIRACVIWPVLYFVILAIPTYFFQYGSIYVIGLWSASIVVMHVGAFLRLSSSFKRFRVRFWSFVARHR